MNIPLGGIQETEKPQRKEKSDVELLLNYTVLIDTVASVERYTPNDERLYKERHGYCRMIC